MIVSHPAALFLLLPAAVALLLYIVRIRRVLSVVNLLQDGNGEAIEKSIELQKKYIKRNRLLLGAMLRAASFLLLITALAGISDGNGKALGNERESRGEGGNAVAFVFDISYSMNAPDGGGKQYQISRLDAAAFFARMIMPSIPDIPISVVLAKGDGIIAVPLTEDKEAVETAISALSPSLMSATGTNLGKGIEAAASTFPKDVDFCRNIWLFTDGDETNGSLKSSVERAAKQGINVMLVGFGNTAGSEVLAGDGKTRVNTALKEAALKDCTLLNESARRAGDAKICYVAASQSSAASLLLDSLAANGRNIKEKKTGGIPTSNSSTLALAAIVLFALSIAVSEFSPKKKALQYAQGMQNRDAPFASVLKQNSKGKQARLFPSRRVSSFIALMIVFEGCSGKSATQETLQGAWAWRQGKMQKSISSFLRALQLSEASYNKEGAQYALYNVAASYISMGEYNAAISRIEMIGDDAPLAVQYAASYNRGVIAFSQGKYDEAVYSFRKALMADSASVRAKENLEIANEALRSTISKNNTHPRAAPNSIDTEQAGKEDKAADAIFERIKEQDKKQWKAREEHISALSSADY